MKRLLTLLLVLLSSACSDHSPAAISGEWDCGSHRIFLSEHGGYTIVSGGSTYKGAFSIEPWKEGTFGQLKLDKPVYPLSEHRLIKAAPNIAADLYTSMGGLILWSTSGAPLQCFHPKKQT
jgi:hypothetical protein